MKISIITVCFNAARSIEGAITSVLEQTYPNIEYIIIDGASTDTTMAIIDRYRNKIAKVISEKDSGIYDAMNKAVKNATGDIVYFLNADDKLYDKDVIASIADVFQNHPETGIVLGKVKFVNVPANLNLDNNILEYKNAWEMLVKVPNHQSMFIRRSVFDQVGTFDTRYKICADYDWFLRSHNKHTQLKFIDKDIAYYDAQGASFKQRYEVIGEKISVVFRNVPLLQFLGYFIFASLRKIRDICVEGFFAKTGIEHSPNLPKVVNNATWLFGDNAIRFVLGFWVISLMARYLGPADFGSLNYALSIVSIFSLFAILGFNEILVRMIVTHPLRKDDIVTTAFLLRCIAGSLGFCACLALISFIRPPDDIATRALVGIIAIGLVFQSFDVIDLYFQSQLRSQYSVLAKNSVFILMSLLRIYLVYLKAPLMAFALAALAEVALGAVGLLFIYNSQGHRLIKKFDRNLSKELLNASWPICIAGFAAMANMRIGQILLFHLKGQFESGIYASATRIIDMWSVVGFVLISSTFPVIVQLKNDNEAVYRQKLKQFYKIIYIVGIAATVVTAILAKPIITTLFGPSYSEAVAVLVICALSVTFIFIGGATTYVLVAENLQPYHLFRCVAGLILNVILCMMLIPAWGAIGAAWASIISNVVAVYGIVLFPKMRRIF